MARQNRDRLKPGAFLALGLVLLVTTAVYAEDPPFAGKWRGETRPVAAIGGPGGALGTGGAPGAGAPPAAPAAAAPAPPAGGARGGGRGGFGGFGGPGGGVQTVSITLKHNKENKISGNITFGDAESLDVKDGKADGNFITFKAGRSPQPVYEYKGELKGTELILTRANPEGWGPAPQYVLTKKDGAIPSSAGANDT